MHSAVVTTAGDKIRWLELPGADRRARVWIHGLGAASAPYFLEVSAHPLLAGHRNLYVDLLGHGLSDRPTGFGYTLEEHADALALALREAGVTGGELTAHSMGGSVAVVLAERHPELVARLVLVDPNLDPVPTVRGGSGSSGIASYTEEEFLDHGREATRVRAGAHWWSTMRLAGHVALHRTAHHLVRDTGTGLRTQLSGLRIPRTLLVPEAEGPVPGGEALTAAGVHVVRVPDCGHNIMLDNPEAFARATAEGLAR